MAGRGDGSGGEHLIGSGSGALAICCPRTQALLAAVGNLGADSGWRTKRRLVAKMECL